MSESQQTAESTVLAVDDETENAELIQRALASRPDVRVLVAFSAREALAIIQSHRVDVMLLDQRLPQSSGAELVERVRQLGKKIATIMVTAYPEDQAVQSVLKRGYVQCVVAKPWRLDDLLVALDMALHLKKQRT